MPIKLGSTSINAGKIYWGTTPVQKVYAGTTLIWSNYVYAFGTWSSWSNDSTCVASGPSTCTEATYNQVQKECQCLWGTWTSYSSTNSAVGTTPTCGQGVVKREVQVSTRSCWEDWYYCNPYDCNGYNCNPYDCNCVCTWTSILSYGSTFNDSYTNGCIDRVVCTGSGISWVCNYQEGNYSCSTCYETCYQTCYQTCWDCYCGNYSAYSNTTSCSSATHNSGYCYGVQYQQCQTRTSTGYLQSKTRTCLRS